jgi:hypothetical protein
MLLVFVIDVSHAGFIDKKVRRKEYINHPGREMDLVKIRKSIVPATPPSKGGETFENHFIYNSTLKLRAMAPRGEVYLGKKMWTRFK